jgi:hypothetical protein
MGFQLHRQHGVHRANLQLCNSHGHLIDISVGWQRALGELQLHRGQLQLRGQQQLQNQRHHSWLQLTS